MEAVGQNYMSEQTDNERTLLYSLGLSALVGTPTRVAAVFQPLLSHKSSGSNGQNLWLCLGMKVKRKGLVL